MPETITPEEIKAWRKGLKMTQAELGAELGVDGNTVRNWENGSVLPESPKMLRLALIGLDSTNMTEAQLEKITEIEKSIRQNFAESGILLPANSVFNRE